MNEPLINKYRPLQFDEVMGHDSTVAALKRVLESSTCPHAFLLTGPSGVGKTTIARIIASHIGAEVLEVDAASNSGIDSIRQLIELGQHMSLYGSATKMFIIDECHGLSRQAWDALLKLLEEPPAHLYIALCTTEMAKVRETILTRCYHIALRALKDPEIEELLTVICECEGWQPNGDIIQLVVQSATGQPRKAISLMQTCHDAPSREEALRIIALQEVTEPMHDLLKVLVGGNRTWKTVRELILKVDDSDFEEAATFAGRYIMAAMLREDSEDKASSMWSVLEALVFPASTYDKKAAFVAAVGRMLWGG